MKVEVPRDIDDYTEMYSLLDASTLERRLPLSKHGIMFLNI